MSKTSKIVIIIIVALLIAIFLLSLFLFKKSDIEKEAVKEQEKTWESLNDEDFDNFMSNNFFSELTQDIDKNSFIVYGALNEQYYDDNTQILRGGLYAKDRASVYMRAFCNEIAFFVKINNADPESFEILGNCYSKDKNRAYFTHITISGADPVAFEVIAKNYSNDNDNVYFQQYTIDEANIGSFEITLNSKREGYYSKDKDNVYKGYLKMSNFEPEEAVNVEKRFVECSNEEVDRSSFEIINDDFVKDGQNVYYFVKGEGYSNDCDKIEGASPSSFEVISGSWAKDSNDVFYGNQEVGGEGVDVETFEVIDDDFAKDDENVYYQESEIPEADPETFEVVSNDEDEPYAIDENNVYEGAEIIEDADPETFDVEEFSEEQQDLTCLPADIRDSVNPASFESVGTCHAKDNNYVFFKPACEQNCLYEEMSAHSGSFEEIQFNHSKDINNIYYLGYEIVGADESTFNVLSIRYSKDNSYVYFEEKIIIGADPATFRVLSDSWAAGFFGEDENDVYEDIERLENDDIDVFIEAPLEEGENCYYKKGVDAIIEKICN